MVVELSLEIRNRIYEFVDVEVDALNIQLACFFFKKKTKSRAKMDSFESLVYDDDVGFHSVAEFEIGMVIEFNEGAINALTPKPGTPKLEARFARQRVMATIRDVRIAKA